MRTDATQPPEPPTPREAPLQPGWLRREFDATADEVAVDAFVRAMKAKLARKRSERWGGWQARSEAELWAMLRECVERGDPVDVANYAMMIYGVRRDALP